MKRVEVTWVDSAGAATPWIHATRETLTIDTCTSVGYLVSQDKTQILLAQSRSQSQIGHPLAIPRVAVTRIRKLK